MGSRHGRKYFWAAGLGLLALAVQALLPFLLAYEIARADDPAYAETTALCWAPRPSGAPAQHGGQTDQHGSAASCPICTALAAAVAVTSPTEILPPIPMGWRKADLSTAVTAGESRSISTSYDATGPPLNA